MSVNLIVQSFGRESEYKRALLTILSYFAHSSNAIHSGKVILFTDQPAFFASYLKGVSVEYVLLTPDKIKKMRGEIDFLHHMKIAVIEEAFRLSEGVLLYADSDTFFTADTTTLTSQINPATSFMHLLEYPFEQEIEDKTRTYRNFYNLINRTIFKLASGKELKVTSRHHSWNAGVMFFHPDHARLIPDVYTLTEQFYLPSGSHASEQYAFSVVLEENTNIIPCSSVIYHYWYRVKKQIVDLFLNERVNTDWANHSLEEKLAEVRSWTKMLPEYFNSHELMIRDRAVQAFNENKFGEGYKWALRAVLKNPLKSRLFLKDTLYHLKRHLTHK